MFQTLILHFGNEKELQMPLDPVVASIMAPGKTDCPAGACREPPPKTARIEVLWTERGKKVIGIGFNSSQFGELDVKTGDFEFGGQD